MKDAQLGFNTNVVYHGRTLHIQTEDSGRGRPHVITHLYVSGTILATKRTSYEDFAAEPDARQRVRELMKSQHKAMILELRAGTHDPVIDRAAEAQADSAPPPESADSAPPPESADSAPPPESAPSDAPRTLRTAIAPERHSSEPPWPEVEEEPTVRSRSAPAAARATPGVRGTPVVSRRPSSPPGGRLDKFPSYRPPEPSPGAPDVVHLVGARERRPGGLRPASDREREGFGKDLISDRSLDEVVLSYLAEELTKDEK
jgi:hypothetical protein